MMLKRCTRIWIYVAVAAGLIGLATVARAADDTARFYGTWKTSFLYNGQTVTMVSVHDASGYKNYVVTSHRQPALRRRNLFRRQR